MTHGERKKPAAVNLIFLFFFFSFLNLFRNTEITKKRGNLHKTKADAESCNFESTARAGERLRLASRPTGGGARMAHTELGGPGGGTGAGEREWRKEKDRDRGGGAFVQKGTSKIEETKLGNLLKLG